MQYILDYYLLGKFTDEDLDKFLEVGMITQAQYDEVKKFKAPITPTEPEPQKTKNTINH